MKPKAKMVSLVLGILFLSLAILCSASVLDVSSSHGTSMLPLLPDGNMEFGTKMFDPANISVGSIVAYRYNATFTILHRVVDKGTDDEGLYYVCQGDNNPSADPWTVRPAQIVSVFMFSQPVMAFMLEIVLFLLIIINICITVNREYEMAGGGIKT